MGLVADNVKLFFSLARERYKIRLRRAEGGDGPWTKDEIYRQYRFCNVFREHDKTTEWFRENIRDPLRDRPRDVLRATIIFRWFNRIETGERIKDILLSPLKQSIIRDLRAALRGVSPIVTGAYMIRSANGMPKLEGILHGVDRILPSLKGIAQEIPDGEDGRGPTLQFAHSLLLPFPLMGPFIAYEVITDLRYTSLLDSASDIDTWANAGPGCTRGAGWVKANNFNLWKRTSKEHQNRMLRMMAKLLELARTKKELWPTDWPKWEMREVEHWLCETCKYVRVRDGGTPPKQIFRGGT